jgi:DNA-directed RNA polymerase subunit RPC12/RpoP
VWLDQLEDWANSTRDWIERQASGLQVAPVGAGAGFSAAVAEPTPGTTRAAFQQLAGASTLVGPGQGMPLAELRDVDLGWIYEHVGPAVYRQAERAVAAGRVTAIERCGETLTASYVGEQAFTVRLGIEDGELYATCPLCLEEERLCVHAAAALIAFERRRSRPATTTAAQVTVTPTASPPRHERASSDLAPASGPTGLIWEEIADHPTSSAPPAEATAVPSEAGEKVQGRIDPLTGVPFEESDPVYVCLNCDTMYHQESVEYLVKYDGGRCANCSAKGRMKPMSGVESRSGPRPDRPSAKVTSVQDLAAHLGEYIVFEGRALGVKTALGGALHIKFGSAPDSLRLVVPSEARERFPIDFGLLERCIKEGPTRIRIEGIPERGAIWGFELFVDDPRRLEVL